MSDKNVRKTISGTVIANKMNKTVRVAVERKVKHPFFGKYIVRTTKLMAHDEKNECKTGDQVTIKEVRPISKNKKWLVVSIDKKALQGAAEFIDGSENV